MDFLQPSTWAEALAARAAYPDALPIAGGTDVMVDINFDRRRPAVLLDLSRVPDLRQWGYDGGRIRLGAGVTYARVIAELGALLPGLAMAARTIGSPQIRNRGTIGGNLGTASPAGDSHPPLLATDAVVEIASAVSGVRQVPISDFYTAAKRNVLAADELIAAVLVAPAAGPQQFCKIGTRNAMVIAVSAFGLALHVDRCAIGTGIGSVAPTPRRARGAERFLAGELDAGGFWESRAPLPAALAREFGEQVAAAAAPIDDVRGSAAYRRHSLAIMASRATAWAWNDYRKAA